MAQSQNNLALLHRVNGNNVEAESLYKRALAIWEKANGSDHPYVRIVLENTAKLYVSIGRKEEAKRLDERAKGITSK